MSSAALVLYQVSLTPVLLKVATGMSVNVGVLGMVMGAVDHGYEAVLVTDAVAGIPVAYAQAVVDNTLAALATRVTSDEIVAVWAT